nr:uncharacterized protein LOC112695670 [Arachis hypogaea]XP_029154686.1 uncharacterized protein LOC112695670 [Arachis hypogaea]
MEGVRAHSTRSKLRSEQIGSGDRSERIRTYNFPQGRVTDHRVGITYHSIDDVMQESTDILLMIVGTIAAIGNGMGMPLMTLIFGQMATSSLITCTAKILSTKFPRSV